LIFPRRFLREITRSTSNNSLDDRHYPLKVDRKTYIWALPSLIPQLEHQGGQEKPAISLQETWMGPRQPAASPQSFYLTSAWLEGIRQTKLTIIFFVFLTIYLFLVSMCSLTILHHVFVNPTYFIWIMNQFKSSVFCGPLDRRCCPRLRLGQRNGGLGSRQNTLFPSVSVNKW
jgi:hypothetical protein